MHFVLFFKFFFVKNYIYKCVCCMRYMCIHSQAMVPVFWSDRGHLSQKSIFPFHHVRSSGVAASIFTLLNHFPSFILLFSEEDYIRAGHY